MQKIKWVDPVTEEVLVNSESVLTNSFVEDGGDVPEYDIPDDQIPADGN